MSHICSDKIKISLLAHTLSPSALCLIYLSFRTLFNLSVSPCAALALDVATISLWQNISFATHGMLCQIAAGHWTQQALSHLPCFRIHKRNSLRQFGPGGSNKDSLSGHGWLFAASSRITPLVVRDTEVQKTPYCIIRALS